MGLWQSEEVKQRECQPLYLGIKNHVQRSARAGICRNWRFLIGYLFYSPFDVKNRFLSPLYNQITPRSRHHNSPIVNVPIVCIRNLKDITFATSLVFIIPNENAII